MKIDEFGKKMFYLGIGLAAVTKDRIEQAVNELIKTGELKQKEAGELKERLMKKAEEERAELVKFVRKQVEAIAKELGFVTKSEIEKIKKQLRELERELKQQEEAGNQ